MFGVQLADVSIYALRMTRASSWNVGKLHTKQYYYYSMTLIVTDNMQFYLQHCIDIYFECYDMNYK